MRRGGRAISSCSSRASAVSRSSPASTPPPGSTQYGSSPGRTLRMVSSSPAGVISTARTRSVMNLLYHERPSDTVNG
jgi:hypothetical protein